MDLSGKVVVVTGGTSGLGPAVVEAFLAGGARVCATYRSDEKLVLLHDRLGKLVTRLSDYQVDVTREPQVQPMISDVLKRFGRIDALVNVTGGWMGDKPMEEHTLHEWEQMLDVNFKSAIVTTKLVLPVMKKQGSGAIVYVGATSGLYGEAGSAAYAAAKAALNSLTQSLQAEVKEMGISVNCVLPSMINTVANRDSMPGADTSGWTRPEDIARVIAFLASEAGRTIKGAMLPVL